jgi:hypothetical protein
MSDDVEAGDHFDGVLNAQTFSPNQAWTPIMASGIYRQPAPPGS